MSEISRKLLCLVRRGRLNRELEEEMQFHLDMKARQNQENGMADRDARFAAQRQFGNAMRIRESCRTLWTVESLEILWRDLRHGVRMLARTPGFSIVAILSLALGIGANTALFSLMDVMLLRPLPVKNPQELVEFVRLQPSGAMMTNLPYSVFSRFQQDHTVVSDVFAFSASNLAFRSTGAADQVNAHRVSGTFFPALGVNASLGRFITPNDDQPSSPIRVAVLSYAFWTRRLGSDPSILGANVRLSGELYLIIGIMPPGFFGVDRSVLPDLWIPMSTGKPPGQVWVLARLAPGVSAAQARLQLTPLFEQAFEDIWPQHREAALSQKLLVNNAAQGTSALRWMYWRGPGTLKILLGLTGVILLIACVNLANLLMARSAARSREVGIRLAIGAGRWRIVRQIMTENLLLSITGGALGLALAAGSYRFMLGFLVRDPLGAALDFRLDYRLIGVGVALSVATSVLFGLVPAIHATSVRSAGPIYTVGRQRGAANLPFTKGLLVLQMVLSMVLLVGAGLAVQSLRNLSAVDLGIVRENLVLMKIAPSGSTPEMRGQFWKRLTDHLAQLPAAKSAALAGDAVFGNGGWNQSIWIERAGRAPQEVGVSDNHVSTGFFATVGIPVLAGREFREQDREDSLPVALVNQTFARRYFGGENPIGKHFGDLGRDSSGLYTIVGVVADAKYGTVREAMRPMVFHPLLQEKPFPALVLHVRSVGAPGPLVASIRRELLSLDSDVLISQIRTLPQEIRTQLRQDRMFATLASLFAVLAVALGMIGIYGIVAYRASRRTSEIGIRMALGAQRNGVLWLMMRETFFLLMAGALVGVPAALAAARLVKSVLFGLGPSDPLTLAFAIAALLAAGVLAAFLPSRQAASVDPMLALRNE